MRPELSASFRIISERQVAWARLRGIHFDNRYRVRDISTNLLQDLHEDSRDEYEKADGRELEDKFLALYSSAALVCNVFDYWRTCPRTVGQCLKMPSTTTLRFEQKHPLFDDLLPNYSQRADRKMPNVDVELGGSGNKESVAVECKFTEPYLKFPRNRPLFTGTYFRPESAPLWDDLNCAQTLALDLNSGRKKFERLEAAQLIKTSLSFQRQFGKGNWKLAYIWYEVSRNGHPTDESTVLSEEIARFQDELREEIPLMTITWQELFSCLKARVEKDDSGYIAYLRDRYFAET